MQVKPTAVITGGLIEANHLNDLVDYYNEFWHDPITGGFSFDANHSTGTDDRRYGWGQTLATITPTPQGPPNATIVTISDINQITSQLNAGAYHKEDNVITAGLMPLTDLTVTPEVKIPTTLYNSVVDYAESLKTDKYKVDWINLSLAEVISTNTASWTDDLEIIHKFMFTDYNEARHFFNSGGELTLELGMVEGGDAYNNVWRDIFDQFDSIRIGAETCRVVTDDDSGETQWDVISTSGLNKGFYTGILYSTTPEFNTILDAGVFHYHNASEYAYAYAYVYMYSEYNSRRIRIQLKADQVGGTFNVYVKVILIEDVDDISAITQEITLTSGYAQPSTAPVLNDPSDPGLNYTTVGSTVFRFLERNAPTVMEETPWTPVDVPTPEQLTDWTSDTNVDPEWTLHSGSRYEKNT
jgi:hypothetical protein